MPKDPEKDWIKKHIARLNIPTVPDLAPRDNTRVRKTGRAALVDAARLVGNGGRSVGPADPTATPAPETTVQSQYRPRYDKAIKGAASFLPPVFGFEGGKETAHQVNAGDYGAAAATAALTLLAPEDVGAIGRKLTGKALPKIARAAIKLPDGSIHWGRSHAAAIDAAIRDGAITRKSMTRILEKSQDGFVDAKGNFLTRAETADRIRALGVKLPKDMRDGNFTSEELLGIPSIRRKAMMEPGALPHQGMRSFDESFPSVGEVQVRAKGARKGKPTPAAVADSVLARAPIFEYGPNASLAREAELLRNDPNLYTAAGPIKFRPEPSSVLPKNYAVLTAENPKGTPASAAENAAHTDRLKNRLTQLGYKFEPTNGGGYFDEESKKWLTENPFLIHDITGPEAEQLAREFNQNSVLTNHGLHDIANGKLVPSSGVKYAEGNDAYTDFGAKGRISSLLDWSDEAAKPLMQPPAFYSRLERAIKGGQNKATPAQWLAQLSKNVNSDERLWTGVDAFLKGADPKKAISRDEVMGVFNKGKINLERKTLSAGNSGFTVRRNLGVMDGQVGAYDILDPDGHVVHHAGTRESAERDILALGEDSRTGPKFAQYTEPGGTNYRENLTILQRPEPTLPEGYKVVRINGDFPGWVGVRPDGVQFRLPNTRFGEQTEEQARTAAARMFNEYTEGGTDFRSSHFDEPNILMHTRDKTRTLPDGGKALHAEEIQSDWHQRGREKGYNTPQTPEMLARKDALDTTPTQLWTDEDWDWYNNYVHDVKRYGVPDAPFKKTDDWQLLGLKQLIDDAVRGGYDRIAWTPGDLQAARYDLSKQVDRILYDPAQQLLQVEKGGSLIHHGKYDPKALPSVIGKEAADRLLATDRIVNTSGQAPHILEGNDLSFGGEGMRQFYDRMLPKNLDRYFKQLGIPSPEITPVPLSVPPVTSYETLTNADGLTSKRPIMGEVPSVPSFPVSPPLWRQVVNNGQPLMSLMGALGLGATGLAAAQQQQGQQQQRRRQF